MPPTTPFKGNGSARKPQTLAEQFNVDENQLRQMQLGDIIDGMQEFFRLQPGNGEIDSKLKSAKNMVEFGNYDLAADILDQIVYGGMLNFEEQVAFQGIISRAVMNALDYIDLSAGNMRP